MKKRILLFTATLGMAYMIFSSHAAGPAHAGYDCTGAETANTAFGNPTGCSTTHCHAAAATTSIGVAIELDSAGVATTHYKGGGTYTVKITGTPTGTSNTKYGFQLNALKGTASSTTNVDAGTWATTGLPAGTQCTPAGFTTFTTLTCMEHSSALTMTGSTFTEAFTWTAPVTGTGAISFWGAANFVNGNALADASDVWNTNMVIINEWPATSSVPNVMPNISLNAFPNPVSNNLSLQMDNTQAGTYTLQAFDMKGRVITTENIEVNGTSHTSNINTSNWLPGTYQVVVGKDGFNKVIPVIKL